MRALSKLQRLVPSTITRGETSILHQPECVPLPTAQQRLPDRPLAAARAGCCDAVPTHPAEHVPDVRTVRPVPVNPQPGFPIRPTCGGLSTVRRRSPVSSGFFSRRMPNTRSEGQGGCDKTRDND